MSDPKKSPKTNARKDEVIEDAILLPDPDAPPVGSAEPEAAPTEDDVNDEQVAAEGETPDSETPDTEQDVETADEVEPVGDPGDHSLSEPAQPAVQPKSGALPLLLGGVLAAALGAGATYFVMPGNSTAVAELEQAQQALGKALEAQGQTTAALERKLVDVSALADQARAAADQSAMQSALNTQSGEIAALAEQLRDFGTRLSTLEKTPIEANLSPEAIAAYERELQALQQAMAQQRSEVETMIAEAAALEAEANLTAVETLQRGALTRVEAALATGGAFDQALSDLAGTGVEIPAILYQQAEGLPTLESLLQSYPAAARRALAAARKTESDGSVTGFLRDQLGVRSLAPKEGSDPDAILSRAEAALRAGRLSDTLAELASLPEAGRIELTDWMGQASLRADAQAALETLRQTVLSN